MKKINLFLAALSVSAVMSAQNLDTVRVRNLTMQAQNISWAVGKLGTGTDSISAYDFRKIRSVIQANVPPSWTTNVTIDSLHGRTVLAIYQLVKTSNAGEIASVYAAMVNEISSKTNLLYWIGLIDGAINSDYTRSRDLGKIRLLDQ